MSEENGGLNSVGFFVAGCVVPPGLFRVSSLGCQNANPIDAHRSAS